MCVNLNPTAGCRSFPTVRQSLTIKLMHLKESHVFNFTTTILTLAIRLNRPSARFFMRADTTLCQLFAAFAATTAPLGKSYANSFTFTLMTAPSQRRVKMPPTPTTHFNQTGVPILNFNPCSRCGWPTLPLWRAKTLSPFPSKKFAQSLPFPTSLYVPLHVGTTGVDEVATKSATLLASSTFWLDTETLVAIFRAYSES